MIDKEQKTQEIEAENKEFKIPIKTLFSDFEKRLKIKGNDRILFSAKFGTGKTYFLNEFFEAYGDDYIKIHLHPTNYQISNNEKIMEFIKLDILINLYIENKIKKDKPTRVELKEIKNSKLGQITFSIGGLLPIVGNYLSQIKEIIDATGIVTEGDIMKQIKKLKDLEVNKDKEIVLVIDDFDRLDPDHIFRILNIFSVFVGEDENKTETNLKQLGFDKIILVADFNNIKNIYHHKYGDKADFGGYFNKFFSDIFPFSNVMIVRNYINVIIEKFKIDIHEPNQVAHKNLDLEVSFILKHVLLGALDSKNITIRQLLSSTIVSLPKGNRTDIDTSIKCLIHIFGNDKEKLIESIRYNIDSSNKSSEGDFLHNTILQDGFVWRMIGEILAKLLDYKTNDKETYKFINKYKIVLSKDTYGAPSIAEPIKYTENPDKEINLATLFFEVLREYIKKYF